MSFLSPDPPSTHVDSRVELTRSRMIDTPTLSLSESLTPERRMAFYERHKPIAIVMILVVLLLPFVGLFAYGLIGSVVSVILSVLSYYLAPYLLGRLGLCGRV